MSGKKRLRKRVLSLCCCVSLVTGLVVPMGTAFAAREGITITAAEQTPFIKAEGQNSDITLTVDQGGTYYLKAEVKANKVDDEAAYQNPENPDVATSVITKLDLKEGQQTVTALTPDTNELLGPGNTATLTLQLFSDETCNTPVTAAYTEDDWARTRHWTFYLTQDMHCDVGYTEYQEELRGIYKRYLDSVQDYIKASEERGDIEQYNYSIESAWVLGDGFMTQSNADEVEAIAQLIRDGKIDVAGGQFNYTPETFGTEEAARATYYSRRFLADMLAIPVSQTERMFDNPSFSKGYVDAAVGAGIKYGIHAMNGGRSPYNKVSQYYLYYMEGANPNNKMLIFDGPHYNINFGFDGKNVNTAYNSVMGLIKDLESLEGHRTYHYDKYPMLTAPPVDNDPPRDTTAQMADGVNKKIADMGCIYPKIEMAFPDEFFQAVEEEYGKLIPVENGTEENWWNDGWGTSAYESGTNKLAGAEIPLAETLASFASIQTGAAYPYDELSEAVKRNLTYDEHTWGGANWNTAYQKEIQWDWKRSNAFGAKALAEQVLENSLNILAQEAVEQGNGSSIYVYNGLNWVRNDVVTLEVTEDFPEYFQIMDGGTSVPYTLEDGTVTFVANNVPAMGYKLFTIEAAEAEPEFVQTVTSGADYIENQFYKVTFAPDGTISSILDKTNGERELVDQAPAGGEKFNQYRYYEDNSGNDERPVVLGMYTPEEGVGTLQVESDGVRATARLETSTFRAPSITQTVTLYNNIPRIDIVNEVVKDAKPAARDREEAYYTFPFAVDGEYEIRYDLPAGNTAEGDQVYGTSHDWYTVNKWTSVCGDDGFNMVLATPNTALMQFGERRVGKWSFDYVSQNPYLYSYVFNNQWYTNFQNDQPGYADFRYSISTNDKGADMSANNRFGWEIATPLKATVVSGTPGAAASTSYLTIDRENVQPTTLKAAEANGEGMILRVFEVDGKDTKDVTVTLPYNATITETDIIENNIGEAETGSSFTFDIPAYGYKTFRIVQDGERPGAVSNAQAVTQASASADNLIASSEVKASSEYMDGNYPARYAKSLSDGKDWAANLEKDPWIEFTWTEPQTFQYLLIGARNNEFAKVAEAKITFSDGTSVTQEDLPIDGTPVTIDLGKPVTTTSVKVELTGDKTVENLRNVGLSGVEAYLEKPVEAPEEPVLEGTMLTWNAAADARYYQVFRSVNGGDYRYLGSSNDTSFYDAQVIDGLKNTYAYQVRGVNEHGAGPMTDVVRTTGNLSDTTKPGQPVLHGIVRDQGRIDLWWTPVTDNTQIDHYELYRDGEFVEYPYKPASGDPGGNPVNNYVVSFRDYDVEGAASHTYTVKAVDVFGNTSESAPLTIAMPDDSTVQLESLTLTQEGGTQIALNPAFDAGTYVYNIPVGEKRALLAPMTVTAVAKDSAARITVGEAELQSGVPSGPITISDSAPSITIRVENEGEQKLYKLNFTTDDPIVTVASAKVGSIYNEAECPAVNLINSSGMSGTSSLKDTHDNHYQGKTMWYTAQNPGDNAWVEFDLGAPVVLDELWIWNMNQWAYTKPGSEDLTDRGLKNVKIEYKVHEEDEWTELAPPDGITYGEGEAPVEGYPFQLARADGSEALSATNLNDGANTPISFDGETAQYIKISAKDSWGSAYWGLSEVRFTSKLEYRDAVLVTGIEVSSDGDAITENGGTLQMTATVQPETATYRDVIWSVTDETGKPSDVAIISEDGLLQARKNGTVQVVASARDESGVTDAKTITISGQRVVIEGVTATAGSSYGQAQRPELVVDNSGMSGVGSVSDTHTAYGGGTDEPSVWHTAANPQEGETWIEFDLGSTVNLGEIWVWNFNTRENERGLKNVKVEYKADEAGAEWQELRTNMTDPSNPYPYTLAQANGQPGLKATNLVDGTPIRVNAQARYVRITADPDPRNGTYLGDGQSDTYYYGLSEVRFTLSEEAPEPDVYTISVDSSITGGTVTPNKTKAKEGETVTLTITPEDGKQLKAGTLRYYATDAPDNSTPIDEDTLTVTMPAYNITVTAEFEDAAVEPVTGEIESVEPQAPISVSYGTVLDDLTLPESVRVTLKGGNTTSLDVDWTSEEYNGMEPATYTFTGTLTLTEGITNPGNLTAKIEVTVEEQATETKYAIAVDPSIAGGTVTPNMTEAAEGETVTLTITPEDGKQLKAGTLRYYATDAPDNSTPIDEDTLTVTMPAYNITVTAEFEDDVVEPVEGTIVSVAEQEPMRVPYGTALEELGLPETVQVTLEGGATTPLSVVWACDNYNGTTPDTYTFAGTLTLTAGIENPSELTATILVTVEEQATETKYTISVDSSITGGTLTPDMNEAAEGETVTLTITPDENKKLKAGSLRYYATDDPDNSTQIDEDTLTITMPAYDITVTAEFEDVVVEPDKKDIAAVEGQESMRVPYETAEGDLGLPEMVQVTLDDDSTAYLDVNWTCEDYDGMAPATYIFTGDLVLTEGIANSDNLTAKIQVTVDQKIEIPVTIDTLEDMPDKTIEVGTPEEALWLPRWLTAEFEDGTDGAIAVTWSSEPAYDSNTPGEYVFTGTPVVSDTIQNPEDVMVEFTVTVEPEEPVEIRVTGVELTPDSVSLYVGSDLRLTASVQPEDATNKDVTWTTSDSDIVSVTNGRITAEAEGTAVITVTTADGNFSDTCVVTVSRRSSGGSDGGSSGVTRYSITAEAGEGGTISPDGTVRVRRGDDRTFTITADEGYHIEDVFVDGRSVGAVSRYTFENVRERHTIEAVFAADIDPDDNTDIDIGDGEGEIPQEDLYFADVDRNAWYADAVSYVAGKGLMTGTAAETFSPDGATTRGTIVTILYRMSGSPAVRRDGTAWYSAARSWAMEAGISDGTAMEETITREQLASMLYRYAAWQGRDVSQMGDLSIYRDAAEVSDWAADAMRWSVGTGLLTGKDGGMLDPQGTATRAEVATILMRFCQNMEA